MLKIGILDSAESKILPADLKPISNIKTVGATCVRTASGVP